MRWVAGTPGVGLCGFFFPTSAKFSGLLLALDSRFRREPTFGKIASH